MYKKISIALLFTGIITCLSGCKLDAKKETRDFTLSGSIKGLKKGTVYLQKIEDTTLVNIDSLIVNGDPDFEFTTSLNEPEVFFLYLDKVDNSKYDDRIFFFAEPDAEMTITTTLKNFESFAVIRGSENQAKWAEYETLNAKFNDVNLNLIKGSFEAQKNQNEADILAYDDSISNLLQRKYRFTGQFIVTHKALEIAPYLAITQIPDAKVVFLEELYGELSKDIQASKYGKELQTLIAQRKTEEGE